jgi:hypothetical protein
LINNSAFSSPSPRVTAEVVGDAVIPIILEVHDHKISTTSAANTKTNTPQFIIFFLLFILSSSLTTLLVLVTGFCALLTDI